METGIKPAAEANETDVKIEVTEDDQLKADSTQKYSGPTEGEKKGSPYVVAAPTGGAKLLIREKVQLAPKPFKKLKHLIIASYMSLVCCFFFGIFSNKYAWEAKRYKELGLRSEAKVLARHSFYCFLAAVITGGVALVIVAIVLALTL